MKCHICSHTTTFFEKAKVLNQFDIKYFQCEHCGFIQTEKPYWLDKAYTDAITKSDLGLVSRNSALARISK